MASHGHAGTDFHYHSQAQSHNALSNGIIQKTLKKKYSYYMRKYAIIY